MSEVPLYHHLNPPNPAQPHHQIPQPYIPEPLTTPTDHPYPKPYLPVTRHREPRARNPANKVRRKYLATHHGETTGVPRS